MREKTTLEENVHFDLEGIQNNSKKRFAKIIFQICLYDVIFILSVLDLIFFSEHLALFILGALGVCVSAVLESRVIKHLVFSDYSRARGKVEYVQKEIKVVHTAKVGGINPFGVRKYDNNRKSEIRLGVFIKDGDKVRGYFLNDVNEAHADYYDSKGEMIHFWGTRFPVKTEIGKEKWLCPICGHFNQNEEKICTECKNKIIK